MSKKIILEFYDRICRNFGLPQNTEILEDWCKTFVNFDEKDFQFCFESLLASKPAYLTISDVYQRCKISQKRRQISLKIEKNIDQRYGANTPLTREEAAKIMEFSQRIASFKTLQDLANQVDQEQNVKSNYNIYDYFNSDGRRVKAMILKHVDEEEFKRQCKKEFFDAPVNVKQTYTKTAIKKRLDEKGNILAIYNATLECSPGDPDAQETTIGYY